MSLALVAMLGGSVAGVSSATDLDDFEVADFDIVALPGLSVTLHQTGLPTSNVLAGERAMQAQLIAPSGGSAAMALVTTGADDAVTMSLTPGSMGAFMVSYNFSPPIDLTEGGASDRLMVELTSADVVGAILVVDLNSAGGSSPAEPVFVTITGPGSYAFPWSEFTDVDVSNVSTAAVSVIQTSGGMAEYAISRIHLGAAQAPSVPAHGALAPFAASLLVGLSLLLIARRATH